MKKLLIAAITTLLFAAPTFAAETAATPSTIEMEVDGLVCAFCAQGITKKLNKQAATDDVFVNLEKKLVAVALKAGKDISDEVLKEVLVDAGYTLVRIKRSNESLASIRKRTEAK